MSPSCFTRIKPHPLIYKYIHSKLQTSVHIVKCNASFPIQPLWWVTTHFLWHFPFLCVSASQTKSSVCICGADWPSDHPPLSSSSDEDSLSPAAGKPLVALCCPGLSSSSDSVPTVTCSLFPSSVWFPFFATDAASVTWSVTTFILILH